MRVLIFNSCCCCRHGLAFILTVSIRVPLLTFHGFRLALPVLLPSSLVSSFSSWSLCVTAERRRAKRAERRSDPAQELLHSLIRDLSRVSAVSAYEWFCARAGASRQAHWLLNSGARQLMIGQLTSSLLMLAGCHARCLTVCCFVIVIRSSASIDLAQSSEAHSGSTSTSFLSDAIGLTSCPSCLLPAAL